MVGRYFFHLCLPALPCRRVPWSRSGVSPGVSLGVGEENLMCRVLGLPDSPTGGSPEGSPGRRESKTGLGGR